MPKEPKELLALKCKCGAFEATFDAPPRMTFNCHCHSCVSANTGIEAKENFDGITMKLTPDQENSGVCCAVYKSNNVCVKVVDKDKIGFMKVGPEGKGARIYCAQCGTQLFNYFMKNSCAVNRNALTNVADGSKFEFNPKTHFDNVNAKNAFDVEKVPEPKHDIPFGMIRKFAPLMLGLFCDGSNGKVEALFPEDIAKVESVPITWENKEAKK